MSGLKKPKLLVVDDEKDNLDLLYRTFRRDFSVFRAEGGIQALEILKDEGEVAVIISDQRMPEMKGTEFLSRTVPQFPDTVRIVLTGFTDVEDLVDAINSGQVYKYITKPWDPDELKGVVQKATQTYDLLKQRSEELRRSQAQNALLNTILTIAQDSQSLTDCLQPIVDAYGQNFHTNVCTFQLVEHQNLVPKIATYGADVGTQSWLASDPLMLKAMSEQQQQVCADIPADPSLSELDTYKAADIRCHLVTPIVFRGELLAVLSMQWSSANALLPDDASLIRQCADETAIALTCIRYYRPT